MKQKLITLFLLALYLIAASIFQNGYAQHKISGIITDAQNNRPVAFATVEALYTDSLVFTDLDGQFTIMLPHGYDSLHISQTGYQSQNIFISSTDSQVHIALQPDESLLEEVVITPPFEKIRYIINKAIANRDQHRPDNYPYYRCNIYHKMIVDDLVTVKGDSRRAAPRSLFPDNHLMLMESLTRRTYEKPHKLQDEVVASKVSGWNKAPFTALVTDILPFDAYSDFFRLNGKDIFNPISKGWNRRYDFYLVNEITQDNDTVYVLSFKPKKGREIDALQGQVYIRTPDFAITQFSGAYINPDLGHYIKVEQLYRQTDGKWFPCQLNYEIQYDKLIKTFNDTSMSLSFTGRSNIDSVSFLPDSTFRFDRSHTVKMMKNADEQPDSVWAQLRPAPLSKQEQNTYPFVDSIMTASGIGKVLPLFNHLGDGKIPVGFLNIDLKRIYSYNKFEKSRLGLGLETNERIMNNITIGGWFGYGFGDRKMKYGGYINAWLDDFKEQQVGIGYYDDIQDAGRFTIHKDIDRSYFQQWLMRRVDRVRAYYFTSGFRLGYWNVGAFAQYQQIIPQYAYSFLYGNESLNQFDAKELSLNIRYAYGEKRAPAFGQYQSLASAYPVAYLKLTGGNIHSGKNYTADYFQFEAALSWKRHINRIGTEQLLLTGGYINSGNALPISKLFAGRGFYADDYHIFAFGGFMTMYPYQYYADRFGALFWKHDFDRKLYNVRGWSSPFVSLLHNIYIGSLSAKNTAAQSLPALSANGKAYNESGIMLNDILKVKYLNIAYLGLNAGYFYHWTPGFDLKRNGNWAIGLNISL